MYCETAEVNSVETLHWYKIFDYMLIYVKYIIILLWCKSVLEIIECNGNFSLDIIFYIYKYFIHTFLYTMWLFFFYYFSIFTFNYLCYCQCAVICPLFCPVGINNTFWIWIHCKSSMTRVWDVSLWLYLDRWVTAKSLVSLIIPQTLAKFITTCHLPNAALPPFLPDTSAAACTNQSVSSAPGVGTHHALVSSLGEGVFICLVTFGPAVGDGVAGDRRVVDGQRAFPAHH